MLEEILFELFKKYEYNNETVSKFIASNKETLDAYFNVMKKAVSLEVDFLDDDIIIRFANKQALRINPTKTLLPAKTFDVVGRNVKSFNLNYRDSVPEILLKALSENENLESISLASDCYWQTFSRITPLSIDSSNLRAKDFVEIADCNPADVESFLILASFNTPCLKISFEKGLWSYKELKDIRFMPNPKLNSIRKLVLRIYSAPMSYDYFYPFFKNFPNLQEIQIKYICTLSHNAVVDRWILKDVDDECENYPTKEFHHNSNSESMENNNNNNNNNIIKFQKVLEYDCRIEGADLY
uniref:Uncharacterized protein n=1 Tax=Panagrolaimus sp. ES5 TaxID=591445 RepID=A0AC34FR49_9BILA